jgi:HNH endonuclease
LTHIQDLPLAKTEIAMLQSILPGGPNWENSSDSVDCLKTCHWYGKCKGYGPKSICSTEWKSAKITPDVVKVIIHTLRNFENYDQGDLGSAKRDLAFGLADKLDSLFKASDGENFSEGRLRYAMHYYRERNSEEVAKIKREAVERGSVVCSACDVDFFPIFGAASTRIVECHHSVPLSSASHTGVTRRSDLKLLCATCHRIAHSKPNPLTVSKIRTLRAKLLMAN